MTTNIEQFINSCRDRHIDDITKMLKDDEIIANNPNTFWYACKNGRTVPIV